MKKEITIIIMALLILAPIIQDVSAAKTVFLTSDNIINPEQDLEMLNSIKKYVEDISGGDLQVIIDNKAPSPGEGYRSMEVTSDVSVSLAASDAGNYMQLAQYSSASPKQIICVNIGDYDLNNNSNFLRRAWDDNYTSEEFVGIHNPGLLLKNAGISYIQPLKEFPDNEHDGIISKSNDDEMNRYIAEQIVEYAKNYTDEGKTLSEKLIVTNKIPVSDMAQASKAYVNSNHTEENETYASYTAPQLLYQTSSYLNGNGLDVPVTYDDAESPMEYSFLTKDTYSIYDYINMAGIVRNYMDVNGRAPDSIEYEGAHISYYDLLYNFALITENHTDAEHMDFEREYHFEKFNDSIIFHIFPFVLILVILFIAYKIVRRIRNL